MFANSALFLTFLSYSVNYSVGQQCDANGLKRYDATFAKLLTLGGSGRLFPENKQDQLKTYCDQSYEFIQEIEKYKNKCMKQLPKQVTGVVVYSVRNAINKYCKKDSKRLTDLMEGFVCANQAKKDFDQCYTNLIDSFLGARNAKEKNRIPHTCCEYFKLFECFKERAIKNKECTDFKIEMASTFINELFGNLVELLCNDYTEGSDKCDTLGSPPKKKKSQRRAKSFMVPYIDLLGSLPELPNIDQ